MTLLEGEEMKDATELTERLRALLEEHGPADLLRAMSASARGLAEELPDNENEWIDAAAAAAQAAEALSDPPDGGDQAVVEDNAEDVEGMHLLGWQEVLIEDAATPSESTPPAPTPPSPNEEAAMKDDYSILPRRKDVTHWRAFRVSEDGKGTSLRWGAKGVLHKEWPIKELSPETIRARWGTGKYVLRWHGYDADGNSVTLGRGKEIELVDEPGESREPNPAAASARAPSPLPGEVASGASGGSSELLAALSAMRPNAPPVGGGTDMTVVLQILAFMEDSRDRQNRIAEARLQAEREIMMERERLASKERIAQLEASAHAVARGGRGVDTEALAEVLGRKVQEVIEDSAADDDEESTALSTRSSDVATMVNAFKETVGPLVTMFVQNAMANNKPGGNGSNGSN